MSYVGKCIDNGPMENFENDKRWFGSRGWAKYQRTFKVGEGKNERTNFYSL